MKNRLISGILATAIGAALGAIIAMAWTGIFQWLGLLIGGLVGYLIYDIKEVVKAIPVAYKYAKESLSKDKLFLEVKKSINALLMFISCVALPFVWNLLMNYFLTGELFPKEVPPFLFIFLLFFNLIIIAIYYDKDVKNKLTRLRQYNRFTIIPIIAFSPILVAIMIVAIALWLLYKAIVAIPGILVLAFKFVRNFIPKLFKLIHSDMRLMIGIDAVIGGAIGLYFQSWVAAGIAGGVWFAFNYLIVATKILKVEPAH